MPTTVYRTIGASGPTLYPAYTNHATLSSFATFINARDLVANDETYIVYVCDSETITTASYDLKPPTYDATHFVKMMPAPGKGVNELDASGALDYGTVGVEWHFNAVYPVTISHGMWVTGMRIKLNSLGVTDRQSIILGRTSTALTQGTFDCRMTHNRILYVAGLYGIDSVNSTQAIFEDNLFICEAALQTGGAVLRPQNITCQRNTFVSRGAGAGRSAINGRTTSAPFVVKDNAFVNCGAAPIAGSLPPTCSNNFADVQPSPTLTGVVYNADLITNLASDLRPSATSALTGAASASAQNTIDLRGVSRGSTPDVGAVKKSAAAQTRRNQHTIVVCS